MRATRLDVPGCQVLDVRLPDLSDLNLQEKLTEAREKTLLPQFSGLYVKRKNQISGHPLKWLELVRIRGETKGQ